MMDSDKTIHKLKAFRIHKSFKAFRIHKTFKAFRIHKTFNTKHIREICSFLYLPKLHFGLNVHLD